MDKRFIWLAISFVLRLQVSVSFVIISRAEWRSLSSGTSTPQRLGSFQRVFIHHTSTAECTNPIACAELVKEIQKRDVESGMWTDIRYNFLVGGDGNVYEGTGWERLSRHTKGYKDDLGIALIGDFQSEEPHEGMLALAEILITHGVLQGKIKRNFGLYGHSDANCVSCPGEALHDVIKEWPHFKKNGELKKYC